MTPFEVKGEGQTTYAYSADQLAQLAVLLRMNKLQISAVLTMAETIFGPITTVTAAAQIARFCEAICEFSTGIVCGVFVNMPPEMTVQVMRAFEGTREGWCESHKAPMIENSKSCLKEGGRILLPCRWTAKDPNA